MPKGYIKNSPERGRECDRQEGDFWEKKKERKERIERDVTVVFSLLHLLQTTGSLGTARHGRR